MKRLLRGLFDYEPKIVECSICVDTQERLDTLEKAFVSEQKSNAELIQELQEKLGTSQHRRSSGRPFAVLQKIAEAGARVQR
jgi:hypothetical protein